ncbi:MAG: hypothetical protein MHM6MM_005879 [Cercozoa sp. M6MM]
MDQQYAQGGADEAAMLQVKFQQAQARLFSEAEAQLRGIMVEKCVKACLQADKELDSTEIRCLDACVAKFNKAQEVTGRSTEREFSKR